VDRTGMPGIVSDDTYRISGGGQYADTSPRSVSALQLGMVNVLTGPG